MFPVADIDDGLPVKGAGVWPDLQRRSPAPIPRPALAHEPVLNDTVGGQNVVIVTVAGGGVRAYERDGMAFQIGPEGQLQDELGREWKVFEDALGNASDPAERLERLPSRDAYWFGWHAFYPDTDIYLPLN